MTQGAYTERPYCARCRRTMQSISPQHGRGARWNCRPCRVSCAKRATGPRPYADADARPWCVACRRPMISNGPRRFGCAACGAWPTARPGGRAPRRDVERPDCPACGRALVVGGRSGKRGPWLTCRRCYVVGRREADALRALSTLAEGLPHYLTPDEREDAAQSIALDILAGKLTLEGLTLEGLRSYASRARGMVRASFSFISLSAPVGDRRTFGDLLEG